MDDKKKQLLILKQFAMVWNYNAHVEHQHNYYSVNVQPTENSERPFTACQMQFFDQVEFGSVQSQQKLVRLLSEVAGKIDISSGRGWFGIYAGYRYYKDQRASKGEYTDFFVDIDNLLPGKLTKTDETAVSNSERYHKYAQLLGREANEWYMDGGMLPPLNEITVWKKWFKGEMTRYDKHCKIIIEVFNGFRGI